MKTMMFAFLLLVAAFSSTSASAKQCEGSANPNSCKVQIFCAEVEPFLIPTEVEVWEDGGRLSLHKFALRSDDTRSEVGSAPVRRTTIGEQVFYKGSGFPEFSLVVNAIDGAADFTEKVFGRTVISPMICLPPPEDKKR